MELHLHHGPDTLESARHKFQEAIQYFQRYGFLKTIDGRTHFGFAHGMNALDNSLDGRYCGVNTELRLLRELGCYADFTLPSAPSDTQTRMVNSIYYATDDPLRPKSHDSGVPVRTGGSPSGDLMIVQGPLGLNWRERRLGLVPRIENADVRRGCPPTPARVDHWVRTGIHVEGRPEWIFVKVHTHGTQERDMDTLLGEAAERMHAHLEQAYNDGERHVLHYVTAREMYNIIKAAEAGRSGNPHDYRDFELPPPPHRVRSAMATAAREAVE